MITRTIWILSIVSMLADIASEMLYPVVPVYLKEIGFSVLMIGILEGVAEFVVGISKGYFGKLSDEKGVRLPFIKTGYFLSALSKSFMALFAYPAWIFFSRTTDRLGKGIRTAARDALLSQESSKETKARVFSFHRAWDTLGAVIGPLIALLFLYFNPSQYKALFYIALAPGLISVLLIFLLKEKKAPVSTLQRGNFLSFFSYWKIAKKEYRQLVTVLLLFAVANSSDLFLILKAKEITGNDQVTISSYILYNLVYAASAYPMGILADSIGIRKVFITGLLLFALVYLGFAFVTDSWMIYLLFGVYGVYAAATEGISKAWLTNIAHNSNTATAIGFYTSCQSIATLLSSIIAGVIWQYTGSMSAFLFSSTLTIIVVLMLIFKKEFRVSESQ